MNATVVNLFKSNLLKFLGDRIYLRSKRIKIFTLKYRISWGIPTNPIVSMALTNRELSKVQQRYESFWYHDNGKLLLGIKSRSRLCIYPRWNSNTTSSKNHEDYSLVWGKCVSIMVLSQRLNRNFINLRGTLVLPIKSLYY